MMTLEKVPELKNLDIFVSLTLYNKTEEIYAIRPSLRAVEGSSVEADMMVREE